MRKNDLSVFKLEREAFKITLKRGNDFQPVITSTPVTSPHVLAASTVQQPAGAPALAPAASSGEKFLDVTSPMVGTFYGSSSPEAPPFVKAGQEIENGTVVCIIEAMKVLNEIKSEIRGTIVEVVAENGKPVQYGQVLFRVRP